MLITPNDMSTLMREASDGAGRLCRSLNLGSDHHDDFRQDLLLDLLTRLKGYDPRRGSLGAFAGIVMARRASRLAKRIRREHRTFVGLDASCAQPAISKRSANPSRDIERSIDCERITPLLSLGQQRLRATLNSFRAPASFPTCSRATRHRHLCELRLALVMAGAAEAA
jgi:hypothetical protein